MLARIITQIARGLRADMISLAKTVRRGAIMLCSMHLELVAAIARRADLKEDAHQRVDDITALLDCWDVALCCALHCVTIQLSCEVQNTSQVFIAAQRRQLVQAHDPVLFEEGLKNHALRPLHRAVMLHAMDILRMALCRVQMVCKWCGSE